MAARSPHRLALGRAIRVLRARYGLTQERIALDAGISLSFFGGVERGERNLTYGSLVRLAAAFDLRGSAFLQHVENEYDQITGEHP